MSLHAPTPARPIDDTALPGTATSAFVPLRLVGANAEVVVEQTAAIVGRHFTVDVRLFAPDMSRRHCRVFFDGGAWNVQDLSSLNGVYVNGELVRLGTIYLGDRLRLGTTEFVVEGATSPRGLKGPRMKGEALRSIAKVMSDRS